MLNSTLQVQCYKFGKFISNHLLIGVPPCRFRTNNDSFLVETQDADPLHVVTTATVKRLETMTLEEDKPAGQTTFVFLNMRLLCQK